MIGTKLETERSALPAHLREGLSRSTLPGLDGVRALAAFAVMGYHFGYEYSPGGQGVLAFYVLSGFLITWLLLKEREKTGTVSLRAFYIRRSLRIFPAFYAYFILVIGLTLWYRRPVLWPQAIASFFYVNNYYQALNGHASSALSHTWSLAVEEQFYLLWPVTFLWLSRRRGGPVRWLLALVPLFWVHRLLLQFVWRVPEVYIYESFDARADHLLAGCLLAVVLQQGLWPGLWQLLCGRPAYLLAPLGLLAASIIAAVQFGPDYRNSVGFLVDPLLVGAIMIQLIAFHRTGWWSWMNWSWLRHLGRISYSVYLYQQLGPTLVRRLAAPYPRPVRFVIGALAVTACASLSYWVVERPFLIWKERLSRKAAA